MRRPLQRIRQHSLDWSRRMIGVVGTLELSVLAAATIIVAGTWAFVAIANQVVGGTTQEADERIVQALRRPDDLAVPVGPQWLLRAAEDVTALGSAMVLTLVSIAVAGFVLLHRRYGALVLMILASAGGGILNAALKHYFSRDRPTAVPQLVAVIDKSFPSGHAMGSAAIYLSLAVLLAGITERRRDRAYILGVALTLTLLIGVSRVYLGVHYPTDVLAGWSAGLVWAMLCWLAVRTAPRWLARGAGAK